VLYATALARRKPWFFRKSLRTRPANWTTEPFRNLEIGGARSASGENGRHEVIRKEPTAIHGREYYSRKPVKKGVRDKRK
jgi:hypothetical protein